MPIESAVCGPASRFTYDSSVPGGHKHHLGVSKPRKSTRAGWKSALGTHRSQWADKLRFLSTKPSPRQPNQKDDCGDQYPEHDTWAISASKYGRQYGELGRGAFGTVRLFRKDDERGQDVQLYAVKEFHRDTQRHPQRKEQVLYEYRLAKALQHVNVVQALDLFKVGDRFYQVMEYCAGGDLFSLLQTAGYLEVDEVDCLFKQLIRGVAYLHEADVVHRDLKPENILLTPTGRVKISDFGSSELLGPVVGERQSWQRGIQGSLPYIAPEVLAREDVGYTAVDIWACGVIYMLMRFGRFLWHSAQADDPEYAAYVEDRRSEDGHAMFQLLNPTPCRYTLYCLLDPVSSRRLTASQFLRSEWGSRIKVCEAGQGRSVSEQQLLEEKAHFCVSGTS